MLSREYQSPCGRLLLGAHDGRLFMCDWIVDGRIQKTWRRLSRHISDDGAKSEDIALLENAFLQLDEYFAGLRVEFYLPLRYTGTDFQRQVVEALRFVSYGHTVTYGDIARAIGRPRAVRAVANAIGANPLSIFIPCHRVVGTDGRLTGYAGGLEAKRYLLELER